jgi:small neutral amino acid transporter SnatA (MarC family)
MNIAAEVLEWIRSHVSQEVMARGVGHTTSLLTEGVLGFTAAAIALQGIPTGFLKPAVRRYFLG